MEQELTTALKAKRREIALLKAKIFQVQNTEKQLLQQVTSDFENATKILEEEKKSLINSVTKQSQVFENTLKNMLDKLESEKDIIEAASEHGPMQDFQQVVTPELEGRSEKQYTVPSTAYSVGELNASFPKLHIVKVGTPSVTCISFFRSHIGTLEPSERSDSDKEL